MRVTLIPMSKTLFVCQNCEATFSKWQGMCDNCGEWNTIVEEYLDPTTTSKKSGKNAGRQRSSLSEGREVQIVVNLSEVEPLKGAENRFSTQIGELDRVLGGGLVPGAVILIGGEPGIGKSTLLTQLVVEMARDLHTSSGLKNTSKQKKSAQDKKYSKPETIMYVCGEENPNQIQLRINRILNNEHNGKKDDSGFIRAKDLGAHIVFVTTTDVDEVTAVIAKQQPKVVIVDSIQTMTTQDLSGAAGSVGQLREASDRLTTVAKHNHVPMFLVGHVTKEGSIAGPKVLEHIVDSVLELSGERTGQVRLLRAIKNRFGATDEVGVFQVFEAGLQEVDNPSELFLSQSDTTVPGSATVCLMEGTRPLLAEVQALVVSSQLAMPRRVGRGIELSRIQVLAAVLQKHCRLPLGSYDIFLSAAGGFTVREPAVDLGLAVAMASSMANAKLPPKTLFIGEVGLLGEVRKVPYLDRRIKEAKRLGFKHIISHQTHSSLKQVLDQLDLRKK